jgi:hypothetical protein
MSAVTLDYIVMRVKKEVADATAKYAPMHSHHEAYAVIKEELDEYWDEVKKGGSESGPRNPEALKKELRHTAAMCIRTLYDLCYEE